MINNTHISSEKLIAFKSNKLEDQERMKFIEHMCSCDYCSEQLANIMTDELISAPRDLKTSILKATKRPNIQIAMNAKKTSKQLQLFLYSLKVSGAMIGAMIILSFTFKFNDLSMLNQKTNEVVQTDTSQISLTQLLKESSDNINNYLLGFTNSIMKTEVVDYDQKEK